MLPPEQALTDDDQLCRTRDELAADTLSFNIEGLRVLAADDNVVCRIILVALLSHCRYKVTEATSPATALEILRLRKNEFDLVITGLSFLEFDDLALLRTASLELDLPVVVISADDNQNTVMKAIRYGAKDYIINPPRIDQIRNVWQHVVRKNLFRTISKDVNIDSSSVTVGEPRSPAAGSKRKFDEMGISDKEAGSGKKKRVKWTADLKSKFLDAIQKIGPNAVPTEILKAMNVPWLTRANVASYLQKFRNSTSCEVQDRFSMIQNVTSSEIRHQTAQMNYNKHFNPPARPSSYQAPLTFNNAPMPLPSRNVPDGFRSSNFGDIGNQMTNSYTLSRNIYTTPDMRQKLDWKHAPESFMTSSDTVNSNFDMDPFQISLETLDLISNDEFDFGCLFF